MLVRVHALNIDAPEYPAWIDDRDMPPPAWTSVPSVWRAAAETASGPAPAYERRFTHGDFQHFNLLWQREQLTGVVDWAFAGRGPADGDVGHCRVNLAVLYDAEWADEFLRIYESEAGRRVDPYWDIGVLMRPAIEDWGAFIPRQVAGRVAFDRDGMHARLDAVLSAALRRL
jgi:aminoglycoside phosphotransferase (APT) family kinase protein